MPTPNPVTFTRARQDSFITPPSEGRQPASQPRRSPPQVRPVRTRPPLWPLRQPHDLPTRRLTNEAVITRPARLTTIANASPQIRHVRSRAGSHTQPLCADMHQSYRLLHGNPLTGEREFARLAGVSDCGKQKTAAGRVNHQRRDVSSTTSRWRRRLPRILLPLLAAWISCSVGARDPDRCCDQSRRGLGPIASRQDGTAAAPAHSVARCDQLRDAFA